MTTIRPLCLLAALCALACSPEAGGAGFETGQCLDGQCFDGLSCLSNLCVGDDEAAGDGGNGGGDGGPGGDGPGDDGPGDDGPGGDGPGDDGPGDDGPGDDGPGGDGPGDDGPGDDGPGDDGPGDDGPGDDGPGDDGPGDDGPGDDGPGDDGPGDDGPGEPACVDEPGTPLGSQCDPTMQNCAGCTKCNPGGPAPGWDVATCVELDDDPVDIGQACTVVGSPDSGVDNCDIGSMCWNVNPATLVGSCIELCTAVPGGHQCDGAGTVCVLSNEGALPLCMDSCDPLLQNCGPGEGCYAIGGVSACVPTSGAAGDGEPCSSINECSAGLLCVAPAYCESGSFCCAAFCDLAAPDCAEPLVCLDSIVSDDAGICAAV